MKRIVVALAVMLCLFGLAPSQSAAKIIVGLSSVNVAFLPVYVTEAKGFFKDEGLDVLLVLFKRTQPIPTSIWEMDGVSNRSKVKARRCTRSPKG